ncbi:MAG: hypothetical protein ACLRWF_07455 [Ruthenibacterium sp.]
MEHSEYSRWLAQPDMPRERGMNWKALRRTRRKLPTVFIANWNLAPAACGACWVPDQTG